MTWDGAAAARLAGVGYWTAYNWDRTGLLRPSHRVGKGQGARRVYAFTDVLCLRAIVRLREAGVSTQRIRKALATLKHEKQILASSVLVVASAGKARGLDVLRVVPDARAFLESLVAQPGQLAVRAFVLVEIGAEAEALRKRITQMETKAA